MSGDRLVRLRANGYQSTALRDLNAEETNVNPSARGCHVCQPRRAPTAGSYASTLCHYERAIGSKLPGRRTSARLLMVFQDPRPAEANFRAAGPLVDPARLTSAEHRYFCLTAHAWQTLGIRKGGGPRWPTPSTAHLYLRRYLGRGPRSWSYDGFIAYFLYLLRPADAYITNAAKCYFASQTERVFDRCVESHLIREVKFFKPNLLLSFTSKLTDERLRQAALSSQAVVLRLPHPASRVTAPEKRKRFTEALREHRNELRSLRYDPERLIEAWSRHAKRAARGLD
jgi:hypothetical protein